MRIINKIIVHCTATPEGRETSVEEIEQWHIQAGYKKIGYHYIISLNGQIYTGREEDEIGAHCKNHNKDSIGVVYVGGCDKQMQPKDTRTDEQKLALKTLLKRLKAKYPTAIIYGHNNFANKACPSFDAKEEYKDI